MRLCSASSIGTATLFAYALVALIMGENALKMEMTGLKTFTEHALMPLPMPPSRNETTKVVPKNRTETLTPDNEFSACLLTMDDNHFLIEWLAYHYHTLPLTNLIVAIDPHSKSSPALIFDRWRDMGMTIEEMKDDDFMKIRKKDLETMDEEGRSTWIHRKRQRYFYKECLRKHKKEGRKWVLLIDADEYLTFNKHTKSMESYVNDQKVVAPFLQQELAKNDTILQRGPCVVIPRLRYGSKESPRKAVSKDVPQGFNGSAFLTMRFRKHAPLNSFKHNRLPKSIIDVSRVDVPDLVVNDPHRPLLKYCRNVTSHIKVKDSPFVVRHYVGTWEQFTFRDDIRNHDGEREASEKFKSFQDLDNGDDDGVRPWLTEFVNDVGSETAAKLLEGVGDVHAASSNPA